MIVATVPGIVQQLRAEGTTVGWLQPAGCSEVKAVVRGRVISFGSDASDCENDTPSFWGIGSAGLPVWVATYSGNETYSDVRARHFYRELIGDSALANGDYVTGAGASGGTRVYAVVSETATDSCIDGSAPCVERVAPAHSYLQAIGGRRVAYAAAAIAVHEGTLVAAQAAETIEHQRVAPSGRLDVFTLPGLAKRASVHLPVGATVDALAVSSAGFAVRSGATLFRFDLRARQLGRTAISRRAADLVMTGRQVVWRTGRIIRSVDVRTGRGGMVAIPRGAVTGLAAADDEVVWAERAGAKTHIVVAPLPVPNR